MIEGEIVPSTSAGSKELQLLATAVMCWVDSSNGRDIPCAADIVGVRDLVRGEQPKPAALRLSEMDRITDPESNEGDWYGFDPESLQGPGELVRDMLKGVEPGSRSICLLFGKEFVHDRQDMIESLRSYIPPACVADVIVDGRSWNEP